MDQLQEQLVTELALEIEGIPEITTPAEYRDALEMLQSACTAQKEANERLVAALEAEQSTYALLYRIQVFEVLSGLPLTVTEEHQVVRPMNTTTAIN